jgi:hypothetical protein
LRTLAGLTPPPRPGARGDGGSALGHLDRGAQVDGQASRVASRMGRPSSWPARDGHGRIVPGPCTNAQSPAHAAPSGVRSERMRQLPGSTTLSKASTLSISPRGPEPRGAARGPRRRRSGPLPGRVPSPRQPAARHAPRRRGGSPREKRTTRDGRARRIVPGRARPPRASPMTSEPGPEIPSDFSPIGLNLAPNRADNGG